MEIGIEQGLEQGREEGKLEGIKQGKMEGRLETARRLKSEGINAQIIAKATLLSIEEIEKL